MKRHSVIALISVILAILLPFSALAITELELAEAPMQADFTKFEGDFTIRGGVKFGMTPDEVSMVETAELHENTYSFQKKYECYGIEGLDSLAGVPLRRANSDVIVYGFDKTTRELKEIHYWFGYFDDNSYYYELCKNISQKYGEPLHNSDGLVFCATIPLRNRATSDSSSRITNCCEWVVKYDDYFVIIQAWTLESNNPSVDNQLEMAYKVLPASEAESMINDFEQRVLDYQQQKEESINNDL